MSKKTIFIVMNQNNSHIDYVCSDIQNLLRYLLKVESTELHYNESDSKIKELYNVMQVKEYSSINALNELRSFWYEKYRNNPNGVDPLRFIVRELDE